MNNDSVSGWDTFFSDLLSNSDDKDVASLFRFVKSRLYQFRLTKHYKPREVLTEVYLRGLKKTKQGEEIKNKLAWTRITAYNVIRELRRELDKVKYDDLDDIAPSRMQIYLSSQEVSSSENGFDKEILKAVKLAFCDLSPQDRALLDLKVIQDLSWKEVHQKLTQCWVKVPTENALRQRKRRAIQRLTECYTSHIGNSASQTEE